MRSPVSAAVTPLLAAALLALLAPQQGRAQEPMLPAVPAEDPAALTDPRAAELDARAANLAAQLRCPVCSGQSVLESNSPIAQEMQEVIRERLELGDGEREVLAYFRGAYGDWIILRPRASGLNLLVYILPAIALLGGGAWLFVVLRRWSASGRDPTSVSEASDAASDLDVTSDLSPEDEAWLRRSVGGG